MWRQSCTEVLVSVVTMKSMHHAAILRGVLTLFRGETAGAASVRRKPLPADTACHTEDQHDTSSWSLQGNYSRYLPAHDSVGRIHRSISHNVLEAPLKSAGKAVHSTQVVAGCLRLENDRWQVCYQPTFASSSSVMCISASVSADIGHRSNRKWDWTEPAFPTIISIHCYGFSLVWFLQTCANNI